MCEGERVHLPVFRARLRRAVATGACYKEPSRRSRAASLSASDRTRYNHGQGCPLFTVITTRSESPVRQTVSALL